MKSRSASATGKHETKARPSGLKRVEKERSHLLYFALVLLLILGIAVVVYAFSLETLGSLFNSDYFNNVVRFSFALLLVATVVYLVTKEKKYNHSLDSVVGELETNMEDLKGSLEDVNARLEISHMVAISEDLHEKLENRFPGMKNHWKRVSFYAVEMARKMELDDDYIRMIDKAGELMDIGMLRFGDSFRKDAVELDPPGERHDPPASHVQRGDPRLDPAGLGDPSPGAPSPRVVERHGLSGRPEGGIHPPGIPHPAPGRRFRGHDLLSCLQGDQGGARGAVRDRGLRGRAVRPPRGQGLRRLHGATGVPGRRRHAVGKGRCGGAGGAPGGARVSRATETRQAASGAWMSWKWKTS